MAISGLLMLLDDITTMLDDVAAMSQLAAKKTAGVLGDDLALNAQQMTGFAAARELPVVMAVAKGSMINKLILVPTALLISVWMPWLILPLLMLGGAFLCFEGFEKIWHYLFERATSNEHASAIRQAMQNSEADLVTLEQHKIKGAIRTDFILSAEIIVIALGVVAQADFVQQLLVLSLIAILMTIGVYGLVAAIVKMDDAGIWLMQRDGEHGFGHVQRKLGNGLLKTVPYLMRLLSVLGTAAMFLVGGNIISHGIPPLHPWLEAWPAWALPMHAMVGILSGALCFVLYRLSKLTVLKW